MATILCVETTTTNCSVAIARDGEILALEEDMGVNYSHSERLHKYIVKVLEKASIERNEIEAIAVSKGPGSYTGLRIGVSSVKGLCYALDIPLISVDTLKALANQAYNEAEYIIPLLDARRMEVYSAVFSNTSERLRETQAEILTTDSFSSYLNKGRTAFIGNGVEKFAEIIENPNAVFLPKALPSAREVGELAEEKFTKKDFEDVAYFEPYYLKDFLINKPKK